MSIIVYGPQGTGKTLHAERLRAHFKLLKVVEPDAEDAPHDPYRLLLRSKSQFVEQKALFITNMDPPPALRHSRRCVPIAIALAELNRRA